jgi:hypothetical protein
MNARGGQLLAFRIAEQEHWRMAEAVREGKQPPRDPDGAALVEIGERVRRYRSDAVQTQGGVGSEDVEKRLVDGWWETVHVPTEAPGRAPPRL